MGQQSAGMPYIGSLISLISKTGVRYEGTLYTIDMVESTIALQNGDCAIHAGMTLSLKVATQGSTLCAVRSFGTEGRKQDGPQIPASERPFEFIIFRGRAAVSTALLSDRSPLPTLSHSLLCLGSDIADLTVITNGPPGGQPVSPTTFFRQLNRRL